jgi:hypothetical protein
MLLPDLIVTFDLSETRGFEEQNMNKNKIAMINIFFIVVFDGVNNNIARFSGKSEIYGKKCTDS